MIDFDAADFKAALSQQLSLPITKVKARTVTGGCINQAFQLQTDRGTYFLKYNAASCLTMFEKEARGLIALQKAAQIEIAQPIACFTVGQNAFLLLEWISQGAAKANFWEDFGNKLANLHQLPQTSFGWEEDNFIGSLVQVNDCESDFVTFFSRQRLLPMCEIAIKNGSVDSSFARKIEKLIQKLPNLIPEAPPALLHGDLWSGNFLISAKGNAILIDPAVYCGHREAEIAFTKLFGGFDERFYQAYNANSPLEKGWEERVPIFNLYPLMVHLNLFGRSYLPEILEILAKFA